MRKLILGAALIAASASSFAAPTQNPSEVCGTAIPGIGYFSQLHLADGSGTVIYASTDSIGLGQTKCVKVPVMKDGTVWYVYNKVVWSLLYVPCGSAYVYHAGTTHGEAWYKMWGAAGHPGCGRAG